MPFRTSVPLSGELPRLLSVRGMKVFVAILASLFILACRQESELTVPPVRRGILKVLDINVWSGLDYLGYLKTGEYESADEREKRYQALRIQIKELDPDIIGIHEANKLPDYAERFAKDLGCQVFYHVGIGGVRLGPIGLPINLREGDAILVKTALNPVFAGRKQLSGGHVGSFFTFHFGDATQILAVKVRNGEQSLYVFATHWHASWLDTPEFMEKVNQKRESGRLSKAANNEILVVMKNGAAWRMAESQRTVEFIQQIARDNPFILMGDFNALASSAEIMNLQELGLIDAFQTANPGSSGYTWDPTTNLNQQTFYLKRNPALTKELNWRVELDQLHESIPKRIDHIFLGPTSILSSRNISVKSSRVVLNEVIEGVHASDHYGIYAEIQFKE